MYTSNDHRFHAFDILATGVTGNSIKFPGFNDDLLVYMWFYDDTEE